MHITIKNKIVYYLLFALCILGVIVAAFSIFFFIQYGENLASNYFIWILFSALVLFFFILVMFKIKPEKLVSEVEQFKKKATLIKLASYDCSILPQNINQGLQKTRWEAIEELHYDKSAAWNVFQMQFKYQNQTQVVQKYTDFDQSDLEAWFAVHSYANLYIDVENNAYLYYLEMPI